MPVVSCGVSYLLMSVMLRTLSADDADSHRLKTDVTQSNKICTAFLKAGEPNCVKAAILNSEHI
jgi:hypothetical protein